MPAFARQIVNDEIDGWNHYPPNQGIPDLNVAIVEWLTRRYGCPPGLLDPAQHVHPDRGQQGRRLHHLHGGDAAAEGRRQAGRRAAQPVLSGLSRRRGAVGRRAAAGQRQRRDRLPARLRKPSTRRPGSACRWSISARPPIRRARSPASTTCRSFSPSAASTTPCWRSTSATPRSTPASRRPARSRRRWRWTRPAARIRSAISRSSIRSPSAPTPPACAPASWRAIRGWWR